MVIYYLMVKTHRITGLKYLCQTTKKDPYKYKGSGLYWVKHLKKHGSDFDTHIILKCYTKSALKEWGLYYSKLWSVVQSKQWANVVEEQGQGGDTMSGTGYKHTEEVLQKIREARSNQIITLETRQKLSSYMKGDNNPSKRDCVRKKISDKLKNRPMTWAYKRTEELNTKMSEIKQKYNPGFSQQATCPHCLKTGQYAGMKRWHFDNCKGRK